MKMAKETLYKSLPKRFALWKWDQIGERCFQNANLILPICKHLENIVIERYPTKNVATLYQGITPSRWYHVEGINLNHPCVGLLQGAVIFEKAKEMLILEKVLIALPHVTFYWVGDGPYREYVLSSLKKYDNFKWLGPLQYPDKVREYLSEIDIYALVTGIDMSPLTLLEAQLMEKPVVATNVGGVSELMKDGETGFLVEKGNHQQLIDKINILLEDTKKAKEMGKAGRKFVANNFSWEIIGKKFLETTKKHLSL
jgi:glycosyltransferase involved in cell wall biosynthesis